MLFYAMRLRNSVFAKQNAKIRRKVVQYQSLDDKFFSLKSNSVCLSLYIPKRKNTFTIQSMVGKIRRNACGASFVNSSIK